MHPIYAARRVAVLLLALVLAAVLLAPSTSWASDLGRRNRAGTATAQATDPHLTFGVWTQFNFRGPGSFNDEGVFRFFSARPVLLRVTDVRCRGDRFRVYDRGFPVFLTSIVGTDPRCDDTPFRTDPAGAWIDQSYSKDQFLLQPGAHRVRIQAIQSPFGSGTAYLKAIRQQVR